MSDAFQAGPKITALRERSLTSKRPNEAPGSARARARGCNRHAALVRSPKVAGGLAGEGCISRHSRDASGVEGDEGVSVAMVDVDEAAHQFVGR
jgi:hypothetical protein